MRFTLIVDVEIEHEAGKFATRDEIGEQLEQAVADAEPGELEGDEGGQYVVTTWEVREQVA